MHPDVVIRRATAEDIGAFYGQAIRPSVKAWVALWKGEVACIAGIAFEENGEVAFSDVKPSIDAPKITIWRTAKALLEEMKAKGLPLIVPLDRRRDKTEKFLMSLGLVWVGGDDVNPIYGLRKCRPSSS